MKMVGGVEICFHIFLISALDGDEWLASVPLYPRGNCSRYPMYGALRGPQWQFGARDQQQVELYLHLPLVLN
jgi:hypothetical protein